MKNLRKVNMGKEISRSDIPEVITAGKSAPWMSSDYMPINTLDIINAVESTTDLVLARGMWSERDQYGMHSVSFRRVGEEGKALRVGDSIMEVAVFNSYNGSSSLSVTPGLFRVVCCNGLVVPLCGELAADVNLKHVWANAEHVAESLVKALEQTAQVADKVSLMEHAMLTESKKKVFAKAAAILAYGKDSGFVEHSGLLLNARRDQDEGDDVWRVFNVVQENIMVGGIPYSRPNPSTMEYRDLRTVHVGSVKRSHSINAGLFRMAEAIAKAA